MALYPVAGCKLYISNAAFPEQSDDVDAADFAAVSWVEVKKWTQMGTFGDSAQLITTDLIGEGRTKKQKGTKNAGSMANVFAYDSTDTGQQRLATAASSYNNYAFKVELNDKTGAQVNSSLREFYGLVMSAQSVGGGANTVQTLNATVEINSNIVSVPAT
jgi:hypothetical protein